MSESQFEYSHLTLDELRSLAASPQVGTLHAMPQSFRALADRVGEVADLLTHTQVNMHQWWKGPAAEQAATMLGQAAAEAREFHGSALAAAASVGRCAQVVEAQQHQMMDVPEVAEPGISAVVPQPTTPFEALEAARQDAAYQAAHQQAVQVVNGIAAQYVETHGELASIDTFRGENFTTLNSSIYLEDSGTQLASAHSAPSEITTRTTTASRRHRPQFSLDTPDHGSTRSAKANKVHVLESLAKAKNSEVPMGSKQAVEARYPNRNEGRFEAMPEREGVPQPTTRPAKAGTAGGLQDPEVAAEYAPSPGGARGAAQPTNTSERRATFEPTDTLHSTKQRTERIDEQRRHPNSPIEVDGHTPSLTRDVGPSELSRTADSPFRNGSDTNSPIIPPYNGIGSIRNARERRNPRPAYLKERKSVWLPKTIAAPPDGVITPEWFEQQ